MKVLSREVAKAHGVENAYLIEGAENLNKEMFVECPVIGLSSGASTPEIVVREVINKLKEFGAREIEELEGKDEFTRFPFPESLEFSNN